jgi:hypothetical protein
MMHDVLLNENLWASKVLPPCYEVEEFERLMKLTPEIAGWDLFAVANAWDSYVGEVLLASCIEPIGRSDEFVGYLHLKTLDPSSELDGQFDTVQYGFEMYRRAIKNGA